MLSSPIIGAQRTQDAAGKCFNLNHALIFWGELWCGVFFNRIITADISAHVRFYYIFVVILQALNFGPQLSWQSSPKTSVPSYSPSSAPAESWRLKMLQCGVLFATEKVLIPDPNRSVNIYCLDVSTAPPHTCGSQQTPRRSSILLQKTGCLSPGTLPPLKHGPVARRRLNACSVTAKRPSKSPVQAEGHPFSHCLQFSPAATLRVTLFLPEQGLINNLPLIPHIKISGPNRLLESRSYQTRGGFVLQKK